MKADVISQMIHLLSYFQNFSNEVTIDSLKRQGIKGPNGKTHIFGNVWEVVAQLRKDGWVITTDRDKPSRYVFNGHYDDFSQDVQKQLIKIKAVSAPPHFYRTSGGPQNAS